MKRLLALACVALAAPGVAAAEAQVKAATPATPAPRYGANQAVGRTFTHDGVRLYYEVYAVGEPLLLIHGNGGTIADLSAQIAHFRRRYQVIAMDSRDHGRSGDSPDQR